MGVYNLVPINGSVMIRNGKSISCTHKGKLDVICKHKDGSRATETWDVKIVSELNHDLFSFMKVREVWILQGICPLKDEWVFGCSLKTRLADQTKDSTTEVVMVK